MDSKRRVILASGSPYRRELLGRLGLDFQVRPADIDESAHAGEPPEALVRRLSRTKARVIAERAPEALVIGSDQLAELDGEALGKPGTPARALAQLNRLSGRRARFLTGVCVVDGARASETTRVVATEVVFRRLTPAEIDRYVQREQPYDCAGSFRSEGLGITLFEAIVGDDPTALMGLPLIRLAQMLRERGIALP